MTCHTEGREEITLLAQESVLSPRMFKFSKHKNIPYCCCPFAQLLYGSGFVT